MAQFGKRKKKFIIFKATITKSQFKIKVSKEILAESDNCVRLWNILIES